MMYHARITPSQIIQQPSDQCICRGQLEESRQHLTTQPPPHPCRQ